MEIKYYPVGIQSFPNLRELNAVYVDKTALIYKLTHTCSYAFLSRPRRFGKSLLCSTLRSYFEGRKDLFSGLAIEKMEKDWNRHPVLHFSLSRCKSQPLQGMIDEISLQLSVYEKLYGKNPEETSIGKRLGGLVRRACEQTGQRAVLIIDEYDAPLLDVLHEDEEHIMSVRRMLQEFYSYIKDNDSYQRFVFITGITKFSQISIFSTINNIRNISMLDEYSAICGITESEMHKYFDEDMPELAKSLRCTPDEAMGMLKSQYDGYHFSRYSEDIYNPFSVLNALNDKEIGNYWFASGTPTFLIKQMKRFNVDITTLDEISAMNLNFDIPTEKMTSALPLLYQSGYVTIKDYNPDNDVYTLGIPNKEVRIGLMDSLIPMYTPVTSDDVVSKLMLRFVDAIKREDIDEAMRILKSYLAGIPYMSGDKEILADEEKAEAHYHLLFYIIFSFMNVQIQTEVRTARGRVDIVMYTRNTIFLFELKINRPAADALAQINDKDYVLPYEADGRKVIKVGVSFSTKTRTVEEWITE